MFSNRSYSLTRAALHGLAILGLVFAAGASASPAYAATNDDILTPIKITVSNFAYTATDVTPATVDLVNDPFISCESLFGTGNDTLWFTFTPSQSGEVNINTANSGYDTVVAVYIADASAPPTLTEIGCNNDVSATVKTSAVKLYLRSGIKYYIEVARDSADVNVAPDALRFSYILTPKNIAHGSVAGKNWDSNDGVFTFNATGWTLVPVSGAYKNNIRVSNGLNNTAVTFFDGVDFDLYWYFGPQMGALEIYVDDVLRLTQGEGAAAYAPGPVWNYSTWFGPLSDGIHKLTLKHGAGAKVNFDYITVYSFPDVIPPDPIANLTATTGTSTGKVTLKWTSVGDDGSIGTATSYEVRYLPNDGVNTCAVDWASGSPINWGLPVPKIAGTEQSATLSGLVPGFDYLFCIAAIDDAGNYGAPSNDADAIPFAGVPIGSGGYDDKHSGWSYVGNWKLVNNLEARFNTLHVSNKVSDYAFFYFTGTQFVLTYKADQPGGLMDVYIDGYYDSTIDQYSPLPDYDRTYTSPILAAGPHSVRLIHTTPIQVTIDFISINSVVDGGTPDPITDLTAAPGVNDGEVDLTWTATGDDPGGVGTATKYEVRYSPNPIITENDWQFASQAAGMFLAPQVAGSPESATIVGLTPGVHYYFAIMAFDDAHYRVLSTPWFEDAVATYTGAWSPVGNYDDNDLVNWNYIGPWKLLPLLATTQALNGTLHVNANYATSAVVHFDGTGFTFTFQKQRGLGKLDVYVDGFKVGTINQYISSATPLWQQTWSIGGLAPSPYLIGNQHVVEFRLVGPKATIDEIEIFP